MPEDPTSAVLTVLLSLALGALAVIVLIMFLKGLYRHRKSMVVSALDTQKEAVITEFDKAGSALDARKAELELSSLIRQRDAGILSKEEFYKMFLKVRKTLTYSPAFLKKQLKNDL